MRFWMNAASSAGCRAAAFHRCCYNISDNLAAAALYERNTQELQVHNALLVLLRLAAYLCPCDRAACSALTAVGSILRRLCGSKSWACSNSNSHQVPCEQMCCHSCAMSL